MAKKGGMPVYKSVDDYIAAQSAPAQKLLEQLRAWIHEAVPEVRELPNAKVPSFTLVEDAHPELQLMMAAYAKYISFYPFETTLDQFADELQDYELGKGTVKVAYDQKISKDLIQRMVLYRAQELSEK